MATEQDSIKLYLPTEDAAWLRWHCYDEGRTVAGLVRLLIRRYREEVETAKREAAAS